MLIIFYQQRGGKVGLLEMLKKDVLHFWVAKCAHFDNLAMKWQSDAQVRLMMSHHNISNFQNFVALFQLFTSRKLQVEKELQNIFACFCYLRTSLIYQAPKSKSSCPLLMIDGEPLECGGH